MSLINAGIFPAKGWVNPVLFYWKELMFRRGYEQNDVSSGY